MSEAAECPRVAGTGSCNCRGYCAECGFRRHTANHGTPGEGLPQYVHEFVDLKKQPGGN